MLVGSIPAQHCLDTEVVAQIVKPRARPLTRLGQESGVPAAPESRHLISAMSLERHSDNKCRDRDIYCPLHSILRRSSPHSNSCTRLQTAPSKSFHASASQMKLPSIANSMASKNMSHCPAPIQVWSTSFTSAKTRQAVSFITSWKSGTILTRPKHRSRDLCPKNTRDRNDQTGKIALR
jgi:hypothetical protein